MFSEELAKIVESEEKADQIIKDAKIEEKKILEDAKTRKEEIIADAEQEGKAFYQTKIDEGNNIAQTNYDDFIDDVRKQNQDIQSRAEDKMDDVANYIYERVVNNSVNS